MALQIDKINAVEDQALRVKTLFVQGHITQAEMEAMLEQLRKELRELYGFPPTP